MAIFLTELIGKCLVMFCMFFLVSDPPLKWALAWLDQPRLHTTSWCIGLFLWNMNFWALHLMNENFRPGSWQRQREEESKSKRMETKRRQFYLLLVFFLHSVLFKESNWQWMASVKEVRGFIQPSVPAFPCCPWYHHLSWAGFMLSKSCFPQPHSSPPTSREGTFDPWAASEELWDGRGNRMVQVRRKTFCLARIQKKGDVWRNG